MEIIIRITKSGVAPEGLNAFLYLTINGNAKQEKLYSATDQMFTPTHTPGLGAARQRGGQQR